ncbi:unnamed protein product [Soboliphyme baturini]|uniref:non-specific serine/threonine protein kinase n=1 Tax=Soboliphyme baturini TaxID=241478 RepID=A0A3P8C8R1_9BILA|nr:unnamed protein product [Soboliphyme baturini]
MREVVNIFCDVCGAVARLHQCQSPVIHRDLKVENLLLDETKTCLLCDFGSATTRVLSSVTHSYNVVEDEVTRFTTLSYRSPEMVDIYSGHPITTKSDIWALGVLLYKLCYFTLPFNESAFAIQNASFSFPSEPAYPPELRALIFYMLDPDCSRRPDIYQVAVLAFQLAERECTIKNLSNSEVSDFPTLIQRMKASFENKRPSSSASSRHSVETHVHKSLGAAASTSVTPRQRPKPQQIPSPSLQFPVDSHVSWKSSTDDVSSSKCTSGFSNSAGPFVVTVKVDEYHDDREGELKDHKTTVAIEQPFNEQTPHPPPPPPFQRTHRRNVSDPTVIQNFERSSRPYHSQQHVSSSSLPRNPFDIDDTIFGDRFDRLPRRRGSPSSTANVKSRESLVMTVDENDPFGTAPFKLSKDMARMKITSSKHSSEKVLHYRKLVEMDDVDMGVSKKCSVGTNDDIDSVGSATDLQARMEASSSSEYEEDGSVSVGDVEPDDFYPGSSHASHIDAGADQNLFTEPEIMGRCPLLTDENDAEDLEVPESMEMSLLSRRGAIEEKHTPVRDMTLNNDVFVNAPFLLASAPSRMSSAVSSALTIDRDRYRLRKNHNRLSDELELDFVRHPNVNVFDTDIAAREASAVSKKAAFINCSFQEDETFRL